VKGLRIGLPREYFTKDLARDVAEPIWRPWRLGEARRDGAWTWSSPTSTSRLPVYYVLAPAEASSNLSRFDGVRYGHRAGELQRPDRHVRKTRAEASGRR
jgi:aspartyl-tRNA(Asn)/glutamyl-tRNA(Gln) amidotransferase subunit A